MRRMRMMTWGGLVLVSLLAMGCQGNKPDEKNQALTAQNAELQKQLAAAQAQLAATPDARSLSALQQQLAQRDQEIAKLKEDAANRVATPAPANTPGLEGVETTFDPSAGTITATLQGDVLFDSGKATLRGSAQAALNKIIADIKKQYPGHRLYVDGHTDIDPINKSSDQWGDNFDLSYFRAKAVADYLTDNGIDTKQVTIRAYGPNDPKKSKAASRRVEIVVKVK